MLENWSLLPGRKRSNICVRWQAMVMGRSVLLWVWKEGTALCAHLLKLPELFCSLSAGAVIAGCACSMHTAITQANTAVKMLIFHLSLQSWFLWPLCGNVPSAVQVQPCSPPSLCAFLLIYTFLLFFYISFKEAWVSGEINSRLQKVPMCRTTSTVQCKCCLDSTTILQMALYSTLNCWLSQNKLFLLL